MNSDEYEIIEFIDLLNYTFSDRFIEKWRYRYSIAFVKKFQMKLLDSVANRKCLKKKSLYSYLTKKCKYADEQVEDFFDAIELEIYYPLVM